MPRKKYRKGVPSIVYVLLLLLFLPFALIATAVILICSPFEAIAYSRSAYKKSTGRKYHILITLTFEYKLSQKISELPIEIHKGDGKFGDDYFTWNGKLLIPDPTKYIYFDTYENLWKGNMECVESLPLEEIIANFITDNKINATPDDAILLVCDEQFDAEQHDLARSCEKFIIYTYDFELPDILKTYIQK